MIAKKIKIPSLTYYQLAPKKGKDLLQAWVKDIEQFEILSNPKNELFFFPKSGMNLLQQLTKALPRLTPGTPLGIIKGKDLVPAHEFALSIQLSEQAAQWEMNLATSLQFLRKEPLTRPPGLANGWHLVTYEGFGIGWVKILSNRVNNYLPNQLRVRM